MVSSSRTARRALAETWAGSHLAAAAVASSSERKRTRNDPARPPAFSSAIFAARTMASDCGRESPCRGSEE